MPREQPTPTRVARQLSGNRSARWTCGASSHMPATNRCLRRQGCRYRLACLPSVFLTASFAFSRSRRRPLPKGLPNGDRSLPSEVAPRKTKHISLVVCSPNVTSLGGLLGLLGFLTLLS